MFNFYEWSRKLSILVLALAAVSGEVATVNAQDFFNVRCDEPKMQLVLITQKPCPSCRVAAALLDRMDLREFVRLEWNILRDRKKIEALGIGRVARTPVLVLLDVDGTALSSIETVDQGHIDSLIASKPVPLADAVLLKEFVETFDSPIADGPFSAMTVTYDISTEYRNGSYNGTFAWGDIQYFLDGHQKFGVIYKRVTSGGQWHIRQANTNLGTNVAARHGGAVTRISPTFRFVNAVQSGMVLWHENRHHYSNNHVGSGLMGPNGGYQILATDLPYFSRFPIKPTLEDPGWLKRYLSRGAMLGDDEQFPLMNQQAR